MIYFFQMSDIFHVLSSAVIYHVHVHNVQMYINPVTLWSDGGNYIEEAIASVIQNLFPAKFYDFFPCLDCKMENLSTNIHNIGSQYWSFFKRDQCDKLVISQ